MNFNDAGVWYNKYRDRYPREVIEWLLENVYQYPNAKLLDLGAGTGFLAHPLADVCDLLVAADSELSMIAVGKPSSNQLITWIQARSPHLPLKKNCFNIIVIGNALHWIAKNLTAHSLKSLVQPGGRIIAITRSHFLSGTEAWKAGIRQFLYKIASRDFDQAYSRIESSIGAHLSYLNANVFELINQVSFTSLSHFTVKSYAGFLLSTSILASVRKTRPDALEFIEACILPIVEPYLKNGLIEESIIYKCTAVKI